MTCGKFAITSVSPPNNEHKTPVTMKITISYDGADSPLAIEISEDMTLADLSAYIEAETGILNGSQAIFHDSHQLLDATLTVVESGIRDGDLIVVESKTSHTSLEEHETSSSDRIELLRQQILRDPQLSSQLESSDPHLFSERSNPQAFRSLLITRLNEQAPSFSVQNDELQRLQQNADDPDNQAKILELIRKQQIEENLQLAYDISPESFVSVSMLYIKLKINGHEAFALVDSGAQTTIIHPKLAENFGILNLIDERFSAMTRGVGSATSAGRIHSVPVSLGDTNLEVPCSFTVIETHVGILFGLDMLRRHKCSIDLSQDALLIGDRRVSFLNEAEISNDVKRFLGDIDDSVKEDHSATSQSIRPQAAGAPDFHRAESEMERDVFPESDLSQLMSLGFTRPEAIAALKATQGNMELAASLLFQ